MNDDESEKEEGQSWSEREFRQLDLGDARLESRLVAVSEQLSRQPEFPINQACEDAAATKAAYRLFANERVRPEKIFKVHQERTLERMRQHGMVLAVQDTCYLDYSRNRKTQGLGPISDGGHGLVMHSTLAVTPSGLPLGILTHHCWARQGYRTPEEREHPESIAIDRKESYKWVQALQETTKLAVRHAQSMVITVGDRESDVYEFLDQAGKFNSKYVIRACYDRALKSASARHITELVKNTPPAATLGMTVPRTGREATVELRFAEATIRAPERVTRAKNYPGVHCWVINVEEKEGTNDADKISWTLLTNIAVTSVQGALERLSWYRRRWTIEEFHRILKSGCQVEKCRLQKADRLMNYVAINCVIAWRLFWLVRIRRTCPEAPATVVLTESEIQTICTLKRFKKTFLSHTLNSGQAVLAIAMLGGYLNRKNDPPPGPTALWRGWQRLTAMVEMHESICG